MRNTEKDAARYRWLIDGDNAWRVLSWGPADPTEFIAIGPGLEHAIDAAMRGDKLEGQRRGIKLNRTKALPSIARKVLQILNGCA